MIILPKSIFLHIPKTGGNWVRKVLWHNNLEAVRTDPAAEKHTPLYWVDRRYRSNRQFIFTFVRHPILWLGSYFSYQSVRDWRAIPEILLPRATTLDEFLYLVAQRCPGVLTDFFQRYTGPPDNTISFVGRQENLRADLKTAMDRAGELYDPNSLNLPRCNVGKSRSRPGVHAGVTVMEAEQVLCNRWHYQ